jgi:hypothetical protein
MIYFQQVPVLRFLSYSIFQKLSGFRLKSTAGMTECGGSLYSDIDEFVKRYTRHFPAGGTEVILAKEIVERVQRLPEPLQAEVPDFVEFLLAKTSGKSRKEENRRWMGFSLQSAFRGMEDEPELYADKDLKERFE